MRTVDINCDLGESFGNWRMGDDDRVVPAITTANVACGFHAGDPLTLLRTTRLCAAHGIAAGAHPGLPDLLGFGRRPMRISPEDAYAYVVYQASALQGALGLAGLALHHIKPHGAMYLVLRDDEEVADAVAQAIADLMPEPLIYWPAPASVTALPRAAEKRGIPVVQEIYPDMTYAPNGELILQRAKKHTDTSFAAAQVRRWLEDGCVQAEDGSTVPVEAESICVHGDGPNALEVVRSIRAVIEECGCALAAVGRTATAGSSAS